MAAEATEATESLPKEAGLVGLDGPLDQLDLTKMLAESFEPQEQDRSEETSPGGGVFCNKITCEKFTS